jgi:hypothetical protein
MDHSSLDHSSLPKRAKVINVSSLRYKPGERPTSWEERVPGYEVVTLQFEGDKKLETCILSSGQQSSPANGWELLLTSSHELPSDHPLHQKYANAYEWTLYGISKQNFS